MFDTIKMMIKCPYCGETETRECQTKQLECYLEIYYENDYVETESSFLYCIAGCKSEKCGEKVRIFDKYDKIQEKHFNLKIFLKDKRITNRYEICE